MLYMIVHVSCSIVTAGRATLGPEHLDKLFVTVLAAKEDWRAIGTSLGFGIEELNEITGVISMHNSHGFFQELLRRWLNRAPPNHPFPQVRHLASALRDVGMHRIALDNLERQFQRLKHQEDEMAANVNT